jgi:hypothetical protein
MARSMRPLATAIAGVALITLLSGCAQTKPLLLSASWQRTAGEPTILLMTPDIELSELTAGGLLEPKADWTEQAKGHFVSALRAELEKNKARLTIYQPAGAEAEKADVRLVKLHDAVGAAILTHKLVPYQALPTKENRFDWTLGEGVRALRKRTGADYALFAFVRDSYASAGRVALIVVAALFRVSVAGGVQTGFVSLVDLKTGDVVWFNRIIDPSGDLRTPEPARKAVKSLLDGFPL